MTTKKTMGVKERDLFHKRIGTLRTVLIDMHADLHDKKGHQRAMGKMRPSIAAKARIEAINDICIAFDYEFSGQLTYLRVAETLVTENLSGDREAATTWVNGVEKFLDDIKNKLAVAGLV